jgi:tetratricopeptide (TPR) repeat protein
VNLEWRKSLSIVYGNIGLTLREQMKFQEAIDAFKRSAAEIDKLLERDRQRVDWLGISAWTHGVTGETQMIWARTEQNPTRFEGARADLDVAKRMQDQLAQDAGGDARRVADPQITAANIAALEGTIKEFAKNFRGAALDYTRAAELNPAVTDERQEEMILRKTNFLEWAGIAYLKAGRKEDGREQLRKALDIANGIVNPVYPGPFLRVRSELERLLLENQP